MRDGPFEEFLKTGNKPGALYSVAGAGGPKQDWEKDAPGKPKAG